MADRAVISVVLIFFAMCIGGFLSWGFARGLRAARDLETPTIKSIMESHVRELADHVREIASLNLNIANLNRDVSNLQKSKAQLQKSFDRAAVDYEWAMGLYQDQCVLSQGRLYIATLSLLSSPYTNDDVELRTRIAYLEQRLVEFGRRTPAGLPPVHSAPATQTVFPHRRGLSVGSAIPEASDAELI
jgi:hypothetical protein